MSAKSKLTWPKTLNVLISPDVVLWEYSEDNAVEFLHQTKLMTVLPNHCMHKFGASCTCLEFCCVLLMYQAMSSREITSAIAFKRITSQTFCDCVWDWSFGWIHLCTEAALVVYFMYVCCYIGLLTPYLFKPQKWGYAMEVVSFILDIILPFLLSPISKFLWEHSCLHP